MPSIEERRCNSVLARVSESLFSIQTYSIRQCANLYRGCQFDCAYCFAASYKRETLVEQSAFGTRIEVHVNGPRKLGQELKALIQSSDTPRPFEYTYLGTTTDSYQPVERKYELTRECLKAFLRAGLPVTVLTKSNLCQRDLDLWSQLAERDLATVGFTLTMPSSVEPSIKRTLEPFSPPPSAILRTLELFVRAGIRTYVFVEPIVPFMTDKERELSQLLREISNTGNRKVHFGILKLTPATWRRLRSRLVSYDARMIPSIETLYFQRGSIEFRDSWLPDSKYRRQLYAHVRAECQSAGLGFSCEGGEYDLWLDDWATVQDPYRHPTGYNLWKIIREHNSDFVTLSDVLTELCDRFEVLTPVYIEKLSKLWRDRRLFSGSSDIGCAEKDNATVYYYKGRPMVAGQEASLPLAVATGVSST